MGNLVQTDLGKKNRRKGKPKTLSSSKAGFQTSSLHEHFTSEHLEQKAEYVQKTQGFSSGQENSGEKCRQYVNIQWRNIQ